MSVDLCAYVGIWYKDVCVCHVSLYSFMCMVVYDGLYVSLYVQNMYLRDGEERNRFNPYNS